MSVLILADARGDGEKRRFELRLTGFLKGAGRVNDALRRNLSNGHNCRIFLWTPKERFRRYSASEADRASLRVRNRICLY